MMTRVKDWEFKMASFIAQRRNKPFKWGKNDCCLFGADHVVNITKYDFASDFRNKYQTHFGAVHLLEEHGARTVEDLMHIMECMYLRLQPLKHCMRGDLVTKICNAHIGPALGVCVGTHAAFVSEFGLEFFPVLSCNKSWGI